MNNPILCLSKKEWAIWIGSLLAVIVSNVLSGNIDLLTLVAAVVGVTSLIFAAKGNVWAQILNYNKFSCGIAYYASFIVLCIGICLE